MVLMALDHTRDFFHFGNVHGQDPLDPKTTTVVLFFTRWITHYCAPVFVFLAGTGAFLSGTRGKSKRELSWFLLTRGLWLVVPELTFVHWAGWAFAIDPHVSFAGVIWAIGWSMVVLAGLIHLPYPFILGFGLVMVVGHNAFDGIKPESWGGLEWLWRILHTGGPVEFFPGYLLRVGYPLIPWVGVMATGYGFGRILLRPREERRPWILRLGIALTLAFIAVRFSNVYGDPEKWSAAARPVHTLFSFLDCCKYPPSLCYLLMTLGPALVVLALLDRETPRLLRPFLVFGRVPLFYYLLHLPLIHGLAVLVEGQRFASTPWLFHVPFGPRSFEVPANAGLGLPAVYLAWLTAILILYPICTWFAGVKRRRRDAWLSYL